jgi:hypothetical protein
MNVAKQIGRADAVEPHGSQGARLVKSQIEALAAVQREYVVKPGIGIWKIHHAADGHHQ